MYKKNENSINSYLYNNLNTHKDIIHTPEETDTIYTNNKQYSYNYINSIINNKLKNHIHSTNTIKKTYLIHKKKETIDLIYNPPYDLLVNNKDTNALEDIHNKPETNINYSIKIENYINKVFTISNNHLKSNVYPDTIKAIIVPYSKNIYDIGLGCASSYYQLYNRKTPIKKVILLCTNTIDTNKLISTSFTSIKSYKQTNTNNTNETSELHLESPEYTITTSLKFDNKIIESLKPYIEINNENIKNEESLYSNLPFIETIAPNASIIPILISNKMYLDNINSNIINNVITILKRYLKNEDTILISTSNFTHIDNDNDNNDDIKKEDNTILQFIYDNVDGYKTRSSKIDDILFMQNTPSNSSLSFYIFSNLLSNYTNNLRSPSISSSSSNSNDDSGISIDFNKSNKNIYSRITSAYTSLNKTITTINQPNTHINLPNDLFNNIIIKNNTNTNNNTNSKKFNSKNSITSYISLIFTIQPYFENNKDRAIDNSFTEYEKYELIHFTKNEFIINTLHQSYLNNNLNNNVNNNMIHKLNYNSRFYNNKLNNNLLNSPIFRKHLGIFITLYKKENDEIRGCIGTSETNNDDYTIVNNIKRFVLDLSTKDTKCRDLIFTPIKYEELENLNISINILYHMKSTTIENYNNHFKFGSDGLLFKSKVNDKPLSKYSLTQITHYFNKIKKQMYNTKDNTIQTKPIDNSYNFKTILLNELFSINSNTLNNKLFYNEGILINSY